MLKFLDNRTHEKPKKSPIKYKPEMIYGISAQAPSTFQTPHTIIHQNTYMNPFLDFQQTRQLKLAKEKRKSLKPSWTQKTNLQLVEEQKIVASLTEDITKSPSSRYHSSYHAEYSQSPDRFKKTRGQFTNFIEKNNHYKPIGPLHGQERTMNRIEETKRSVWLKPDCSSTFTDSKKNSILYSNYFDMMRQSSQTTNTQDLFRNHSSMSNNSKLISEKIRIRCNRQKLNTSFKNQLHIRKKSSPYNFQLPKLQSQMLLNFRQERYSSDIKKKNEDLADLDAFDNNMKKKFK